MTPNVEPFDGPIGAAITAVDLSEELDESTQGALLEAWNRHSVLVFRDQQLSPEPLIRFSRRFGELEVHVLDQYLHPEHPEILVVSNIVENGRHVGIYNAGKYWHSDLSYMAEPSRGSILYAVEIPEENGQPLGDTMWTSTAAAYEALGEPMQRRLDGLTATFSLDNRFTTLVSDGDEEVGITDDQKTKTPEVKHPIVRTHPVTGRKCIFANKGHTSSIVGLEEDESRLLLEELWEHCTRPEFVYRHRWQPGDVVMWDNVPTQHLAIRDYDLPHRRLLHRTTLTGTRPF